jgi:hypothetical protein
MSDTERRYRNEIRRLRRIVGEQQSEVERLTAALEESESKRKRKRSRPREEMNAMTNGPFPPAQPEAPEGPPPADGGPDDL